MDIIKSIIFSVANGVAFLGDLVLYILIKLPIEIFDQVALILGRINRKLTSKKTLNLPKGKKRNGLNLVLNNLSRLFAFLWASYWKRRDRLKEERLVEERKRAREQAKKVGFRPSIFYKLKYVLVGFFLSTLFVFVPLISFIFISDLPNLSDLSVNYIPKTTKIYDRNNVLLYEIYAAQNRTVVNLEDVPDDLINAVVAIEDKEFYQHPGFDLRGMVRAFVVNVRQRGFQGGSTITQQLVKSAFLTPEPTIVRKIKEVALAFWAERRFSKNEIMELYLNYVPFGGTAWGIESASDIYFGKNVQELTLAESAFLAGLPQSPSTYSPHLTESNAYKGRQKEVLDAMVNQGYISRKTADEAYAQELSFRSPRVPIRAPHFVMYVRDWLIDKYGISEVERGGLSVKTSLDLNLQQDIEPIVATEVEANEYLNVGNGAALISDPKTGDILAMIGSRDYYDEEHDGNVNITTALRQPGSSIKLVTYTLALSEGLTEATILDDTPLTIPGVDGAPSYTPVNYDSTFHGRVPLRSAFANSYNIPPVRLTQRFGAEAVKDFGVKMGIDSWKGAKNYGVSITLGGLDLRMVDLVTAYGVVANSGNKVELDPLLEVRDSYGSTIYKKTPSAEPVVSSGVAFIISDILADNNARSRAFGPNSTLNIPGAKVSVKTGTTDNKRDNWTIGYTPNVVVATWVGNNDNTPLSPNLASGVTGAAPMWNKIMKFMLDKIGTPSATTVPAGVVKKFCMGQDRYFVSGSEKAVNCQGNFGNPTPTPQLN